MKTKPENMAKIKHLEQHRETMRAVYKEIEFFKKDLATRVKQSENATRQLELMTSQIEVEKLVQLLMMMDESMINA